MESHAEEVVVLVPGEIAVGPLVNSALPVEAHVAPAAAWNTLNVMYALPPEVVVETFAVSETCVPIANDGLVAQSADHEVPTHVLTELIVQAKAGVAKMPSVSVAVRSESVAIERPRLSVFICTQRWYPEYICSQNIKSMDMNYKFMFPNLALLA